MMALFINGEKVEENEIQGEMERLRPQYEPAIDMKNKELKEKQLYDWSRETVIERVLIRQAAVAEGEKIPVDEIDKALRVIFEQYGSKEEFYEQIGLSPSEDEARIRKGIEQEICIERLMSEIVSDVNEPSNKDIRKFYEDNIDQFAHPEMIRALHIVKRPGPDESPAKVRAEMQRIRKELKENVDFKELARQHSDCNDGGGDLGYFPRGQMVTAFEEVVFSLEVGELSSVFETEFGYHIAKVTDKTPAGTRPFDEVRDDIKEECARQMKTEAIEKYLDDQKARTTIEER